MVIQSDKMERNLFFFFFFFFFCHSLTSASLLTEYLKNKYEPRVKVSPQHFTPRPFVGKVDNGHCKRVLFKLCSNLLYNFTFLGGGETKVRVRYESQKGDS